jgi:hypothetical protein
MFLPGSALNCDPPISASEEDGITVMCHHTRPINQLLEVKLQ